MHDCLKAADKLKAERGVSAEVIDLRSLVPLDMETVLRSVQKTGRCVVASQAIQIGSFTGEIVARIQDEAFDYLDAPVKRVGAKNGIAPRPTGSSWRSFRTPRPSSTPSPGYSEASEEPREILSNRAEGQRWPIRS